MNAGYGLKEKIEKDMDSSIMENMGLIKHIEFLMKFLMEKYHINI